MEVKRLIHRPPATIRPSATLREAAAALTEENVGALLVTNHGYLVGIISERDVIGVVADGGDLDDTVESVMADDPYRVTPDTSVGTAARLMTEHSVRHLPVVSPEHLVTGVVSVRDLLFAALDETNAEAHLDWLDYLMPDRLSSPADGS